MSKIICVQCRVVLIVKTTGIVAVEFANEEPSALWSADLFECPNCARETAGNFGAKPYSTLNGANFWGQHAFALLNKTVIHFQ